MGAYEEDSYEHDAFEHDAYEPLAAARTESFVAALTFVEHLDLHEVDLLHGLYH